MAEYLNITAPSPRIVMNPWNAISISAPDVTLTITGYDNPSLGMHLSAPVPEVEVVTASGPVEIIVASPVISISGRDVWNEITIRAPPPEVTISSYNTVGELGIIAPVPTLTITGNNGQYVTVDITAPDPVISISGHFEAAATVDITAPLPTIHFDIVTVDSAGADLYHCLVLNTDTWEISEYTPYSFDQLVKFGSKYLGVNSTGIFTLTGDTFNSTNIDSTWETGLDDFDIIYPKRISDMYVDWDSEENAIMSIIMDGKESETAEHTIPATNGDIAVVRVACGKPHLRKHIGLKIENDGGSDFSIYNIELHLTTHKTG